MRWTALVLLLVSASVHAQPEEGSLAFTPRLVTVPEFRLSGPFAFTTTTGVGAGLQVAFHVSPAASVYFGVEHAVAASDRSGVGEEPTFTGGAFLGGYARTTAEAGGRMTVPTGARVRPVIRLAMIGITASLEREPNVIYPESERRARGAGVVAGAGVEVDLSPQIGLEAVADLALLQVSGMVPDNFGNIVRNEAAMPRLGVGLVWRP